MHPELEFLVIADVQDRTIRDLRKKKRVLETNLAKAISREESTASAAQTLTDELAANRARQHELQRSIESYEARLQSATRVLESGGGDPDAAQRQVESVTEMLDTLETEVLELMERQEAANTELADATKSHQSATEFLEAERANHEPAMAKLRAAYQDVLPIRKQALSNVDDHVSIRYENLVGRKGRALSEVTKGSCGACQMVVRQQHIADLDKGRMHTCGGCGRWLFLT